MSDLSEAQWRGMFYEWFRHQDLVNGATGTWKGEWTAGLADSLFDALAAEGWSLHRLDDPTQADTLAWVRSQWPDAVDVKSRALKLGEEAGEVQGAVVKMSEGRRTLADLETETAQLVICAMALAESAGFDLWAAVTAEYRSKALVPVESGETE